MNQFVTMLGWGLECSVLVMLTPFGWIPCLIGTGSAFRAIRNDRWPRSTWLLLGWPTLLSLAAIAWGILHWHSGPDSNSQSAEWVLDVFPIIYLLGSLLTIFLNKRARGASMAVLSFGSIPFMGCVFVASMATSGTWL